jgi:hypothetical protein
LGGQLWGFTFYRNAELSFPLGATPELFWPFGTSVAFTDANPWMAVLFKLLSPLLPLDFQYAGLWFLLCFVLLGVTGTRLTACFTRDPLRQALGGCLFVLTPLLPARSGHVALCAFFFLTAMLQLYLRPTPTRERALHTLAFVLPLVVWSSGTHGYLSLMVLALALALIVRLGWVDKLLRWQEALGAVVAYLTAAAFTYYLFGYIGWKETELTAEGFGQFSSDLGALVNPQEWSRWFSALPMRPRQGEGFAYLGSGVLALLLVALLRALRSRRPRFRALVGLAPLLVVVALMWMYALSSQVCWQGELVLDARALYREFDALTGIFRSSGRFVWPLHFMLMAGAVWGGATLEPRWLGRLLLVLAVGAQAAELNPKPLSFEPARFEPLRDPIWATTSGSYRHLALQPLQLLWVCPYDHQLVNRLSYEAYRRKLSFNSGNFMRKEPNLKPLCRLRVGREAPLDEQTVYVVDRRHLADFGRAGAVCGRVDGLAVCVDGARDTPLLRLLRQRSRGEAR